MQAFRTCVVTVCFRPLLDPLFQLSGLAGFGSQFAGAFSLSFLFRHRRLRAAKAPARDACRGQCAALAGRAMRAAACEIKTPNAADVRW
jgi:hypothetical protein